MSKSTVSSQEESPSSAIEKIFMAAELEFSERGFAGAGMKAISVRAEVSQALLHYHFGTKDRLYAQVIGRRSKMINSERQALLAQVNFDAPNALEKVLEAFFKPPLGPSGGTKPYSRIFAGLVVGHQREQNLVEELYDPTALIFIDAIRQIIPELDQARAAMCYSLSLGALIAVIGRDGRAERLMGQEKLQSIDGILKQLVLYAKGGIAALAVSE